MKIGCLGPQDSYSCLAAERLAPQAEIVTFSNFPAVVNALKSGAADEIALPIENTIQGGVLQNMDLLAKEEDLFADPDADAQEAKTSAAEARAQVKADAAADDFKKAVECVINTRRASTSHFQRQMGWGYNHAAKILDMLTERGIVSPQQGMGPRQIVMSQEELLAIFNGGAAEADAPDATDDAADAAVRGDGTDDGGASLPPDAEPDLFSQEEQTE